MRHSAQLRMGSREQQTTKGLQEKAVTLRANRIKKSLDYSKVENPLYVGQRHELRRSAAEDPVVHLHSIMNHNEQSLRSMDDKNDGLVKHMRNLPGYLQRVEKGENIQGKALNFGVLDWGRLENWKSNEKRIPPRYNVKTSLSSNNPTLVESGSSRILRTRKKIHPPRKDQQASNGCQLNSSSRERLPPGVRWPRGKAVKVQISESSPGRMLDVMQTPCWKDLPSGSKCHVIEHDSSKVKQVDEMTTSERETSSSDWRKQGSWHSPRHIMRTQANATKMLSEENINHANDPCPSGNHNAVPSLPGDFPRNSFSNDLGLSDSRNSCDGNLIEANERRPSSWFSPAEFDSISPFSEVPHSCPFPLSARTNPEPECPYEIPATPLRGRLLEENMSVVQNLTSGEACKKFDRDMFEQPALKGRHSSPNGRFSFSLGKMTRSFSFKESSAVPQLSSTYTSVKSGPVNFEASTDSDDHNWKKGNSTNASRSSPLRRLLDPLLKLKGAHLAEKVQKSKTDPNSTSAAPLIENELLWGKKHRSSNVQALLQLTLKNGIPFFKLVVESSSDILAAAVKKLPSGKDDSSLTYAFYSVHETKKKSGGWIYQGSKEKSYGFGYNIVGQMKISSSYHAEFSGPEKDLYVVRESVLYSTDVLRADRKALDCMLDRELAAIIVKNPSDATCGDIGSSKSTVVIIPDGAHSLPNCGLPSPLINRWRSGGACDCGGWDIGCQFRVLSHQNEMVKTPSPSMLCTSSNRLELCSQGGHKNECSFSLVSLQDGLYSLEYDPSISLLQAFSICVAVISSQKLTHIFQVDYVPEPNDLSKPVTTGYEKVKRRDEIPPKYISKPPASPVGRV